MSGGSLNLTKDAIGKQLLDDGVITNNDAGRTQKSTKYKNKSYRVWVLKKEALGLKNENN